MSISKIKEKSLTTGAITDANFDKTVITDQTLLDESANDADVLLIYDTSAGTLKKIAKSNVGLTVPAISSVSPTNVLTGDGTGNATFTITGTGFIVGTSAKLLTSGGSEVDFDSVTRNSTTQITGVIAISSLSNANEPYGVKVISGNSLSTSLTDQININAQPEFTTSAGSLGSDRFGMSSVSVNATDPESAGNVTFELQSGSLPPGISLVNTAAEGGTATFTGTFSSLETSDTVYNFTLRAVDAASNTTSRAFSFTALGPQIESFTTSGTFSVPSPVTSVDVLVVAGGGSGGQQHGGGGGAGGLIYFPGYPVTPGGTVSVTVGNGGQGGTGSVPAPNATGQDSVFGTLTAKGGGGGSYGPDNPLGGRGGGQGGSGGGAGYQQGQSGTGIQPTQPGNSGAYGFGNNGGPGTAGPNTAGGGGGGAGAVGGSSNPRGGNFGGCGGIGKAYTIADGTTPVYYAGGGGGGGHVGQPAPGGGCGGQGGGGAGGGYGPYTPGCEPSYRGVDAQANKGGGGGGSGPSVVQASQCAPGPTNLGAGGKGIVIVAY